MSMNNSLTSLEFIGRESGPKSNDCCGTVVTMDSLQQAQKKNTTSTGKSRRGGKRPANKQASGSLETSLTSLSESFRSVEGERMYDEDTCVGTVDSALSPYAASPGRRKISQLARTKSGNVRPLRRPIRPSFD